MDIRKLALGTAQFGLEYGVANESGRTNQEEVKAILQLARSNGVFSIDTAIAYGDSEEQLGTGGTTGFNVVSKLPAIPENCVDIKSWVRAQVLGSLSRLNTDCLHGVLLHRPEQLRSLGGSVLYESLEELKKEGLVKKIGISVYSPNELELLIPSFKFDLVQAPLNLIDQRMHISGWLGRLKCDGIEVHTRSAFLQGLLLMPPNTVPEYFSHWKNIFTKWHGWLAENNASAIEACLSYLFSIKDIDHVIVGTENFQQFAQVADVIRNGKSSRFPDIQCNDEKLINPALWNY